MKRYLVAVVLMVLVPVVGAEVKPNGLVILLTDYGADSFYVGTLKGAIYGKFPAARIDAITNSVPEFDVPTGAYMLMEASKEFPEGTTFCCVVDPGVGSARKCVAVETASGHLFVGPDNGLLWLAAEQLGVVEVRECTNQALWRGGTLTHTFHGRDIFGPVAAALASGAPFKKVGPKIEALKAVDFGEAKVDGDTIRGIVTRVDGYGNVITNISYRVLAECGFDEGDLVEVAIGKARFEAPLKRTYSDVPEGQRLGLIQSMGYLEFAINMGSLADAVGEASHAPVQVKKK